MDFALKAEEEAPSHSDPLLYFTPSQMKNALKLVVRLDSLEYDEYYV